MLHTKNDVEQKEQATPQKNKTEGMEGVLVA